MLVSDGITAAAVPSGHRSSSHSLGAALHAVFIPAIGRELTLVPLDQWPH